MRSHFIVGALILLGSSTGWADEELPPIPEDAEHQYGILEIQTGSMETSTTSIVGSGSSVIGIGESVAKGGNAISSNSQIVADSTDLLGDDSGAISDQERALQENDQALMAEGQRIDEDALRITESGEEIQLALKGDVLFAFNRSGVRKSSVPVLEQVRDYLKKYPGKEISLEGHTDSIGSVAYNQVLSLKRAHSVRAWLIHKGAVSAQGLTARGLGEGNPVASNTHPDGSDNPEGRAKNRRVEIRIKK